MTRPRLFLLLALAPALAACSRPTARPEAAPPPAAAHAAVGQAGSAVVAEIDGQPVLAAELDRKAESRLARLRQEEYEIRKQALDELIWERLLEKEAARRGLTTEALVAREVDGKAEGPSDSEIDTIYEQNRGRFAGRSREDAVARIRMVLTQRAREARRSAYDEELRRRAKVAVRLSVPRAAVDIPAGAPSAGPDSAPVTIVEFTDYQCPYCHRAQAVVDELLDRYRGKVRLVHRDFPLEGHPGAFPAARAARCAGEQGRFWPYHRSLMTVGGPLDDADLKKRAAAADLDASKFAACVASPRNDDAIRASLAEGEALGVTGTPAYFINGRMLSGARPIEDFAEVIDAELAGR